MAKRKQDEPRFYVWHLEPNRVLLYAKHADGEIQWTTDQQQASLFTYAESYHIQQTASFPWECSFTHCEEMKHGS